MKLLNKSKKINEVSKDLNNTTKDYRSLNEANTTSSPSKYDINTDYINKPIYSKLEDNLDFIKKMLGKSFDLITRTIILDNEFQKIKVTISYLQVLADDVYINDIIMKTISTNYRHIRSTLKDNNQILDYFNNTLLSVSTVSIYKTFGDYFNSLCNGNTIIFIEDIDCCIVIDSKGIEQRGVEQPVNENSIKGGHDAFNETFKTNISLIRKRIKLPSLRAEKHIIGKKSNTNIAIMYIEGLADQALVNEVRNRIKETEEQNIIDVSYLEYYFKEKQLTLFPLSYTTERPDIAVSNIFEGRVVIVVDGSPTVFIAPTLLIQHIQSDEDFYQKSIIATFFRSIRYFSLFIGLYLPAIYITLVYFHSELLPLTLLLSISGQRQDVPFPVFIEVLIITLGFDLLRESGIRMPKTLGSPLSFLGAIIIGQSAVEAGLVTPIIVIIVTITGLSTFAIPSYDLNLTITVLRYVNIFIAVFGGLFGLTLSFIVLLTHLTSLRSFGISYLSPYAPLSISGMRDSVLRSPMSKIFRRKNNINNQYPY